jgi:uncharacterized surface protein with fasciclin (FAS1) repeats
MEAVQCCAERLKINAMDYRRFSLTVITMLIFTLYGANYADATDELSSIVRFQDKQEEEELVQVFRNMGFPSLAMLLHSRQNLLVGRAGPLTIFAPTEEAFRNFNSSNSSSDLSSDYLLSHHIAKGHFTYAHLVMQPDGKKLDTIASVRSIVVTFNSHGDLSSSTQLRAEYRPVYLNGVLLSHPDLLSDGLLTIHGVDQFLVLESSSPASAPTSAPAAPASAPASAPAPAAPTMLSPSLPASPGPDQPLNIILPFMLEDAMLSLRDRGYSILALAMRAKSPELLRSQSLAIFTLSDDSVFLKDGQDFVDNVTYHVVPNRRLLLADLMHLPAGTVLHTLLDGQSLVVTNSKPFSVNHVGVKIPDAFTNRWIAVHEIGRPLVISSHPHQQHR